MLWRLTSASRVLTTPRLITVAGMLTALIDIATTGTALADIATPGTTLAGIALTGILLFSECRIICLQLLIFAGVDTPPHALGRHAVRTPDLLICHQHP
jgi:hypothetical protein